MSIRIRWSNLMACAGCVLAMWLQIVKVCHLFINDGLRGVACEAQEVWNIGVHDISWLKNKVLSWWGHRFWNSWTPTWMSSTSPAAAGNLWTGSKFSGKTKMSPFMSPSMTPIAINKVTIMNVMTTRWRGHSCIKLRAQEATRRASNLHFILNL